MYIYVCARACVYILTFAFFIGHGGVESFFPEHNLSGIPNAFLPFGSLFLLLSHRSGRGGGVSPPSLQRPGRSPQGRHRRAAKMVPTRATRSRRTMGSSRGAVQLSPHSGGSTTRRSVSEGQSQHTNSRVLQRPIFLPSLFAACEFPRLSQPIQKPSQRAPPSGGCRLSSAPFVEIRRKVQK